ncbi:MAG: redox-sensing transcriptional repressor Rex, partial [Actinobacteria bacterium]|nr:redox-sensing transcriptional repressor Rex [Actinomycetota bacterium]
HREQVAGIDVRPFSDLASIVEEQGVAIGVISTPAHAAQDVADAMVAAGISSILNFAPQVLAVPQGVDVRKVDLSIELQILAYHQQRKSSSAAGQEPVALDGVGDAGGLGDLDGRVEAPA